MSVRAKEMLGSIKDALRQLAQQGDAYTLSKNNNTEQIPLTHHTHVLSREIDPDDYPLGEESWMAAFFRQWALDHEEEHGAMEEGWGV